MLPLRDDVPTRSTPASVVVLIALNVAVFFGVLALGERDGVEVLERWGLVPREFLRGALQQRATEQLVWLTPFSAMFLHVGLLHLGGNMLYLWIFGTRVEDLLGVRRFLVLYGACGLAAAALHVASAPTSYVPSVGASGAVSGLLGAYAVSYPTGRLRLLWPPARVPAFLFLLAWIAIQLAAGLAAQDEGGAGTAWWAHVGGFVAGAALARSMWLRRPTRSRLRI